MPERDAALRLVAPYTPLDILNKKTDNAHTVRKNGRKYTVTLRLQAQSEIAHNLPFATPGSASPAQL